MANLPVVPEDRFTHQSLGFVVVVVESPVASEPAEILLVRVVETPAGEPIDSATAVTALIGEVTTTLDESDPATIAGLEARVFDCTAEPNPQPRPDDAIFRTVEGGVGGWGPAGEGRVWLLDTARGIMLLSAGVLEPGAVDLAEVIAEAETRLRRPRAGRGRLVSAGHGPARVPTTDEELRITSKASSPLGVDADPVRRSIRRRKATSLGTLNMVTLVLESG